MKGNLANAYPTFQTHATHFHHENSMALSYWIESLIIMQFAKIEKELSIYQNAMPVKTACESYVPTSFSFFLFPASKSLSDMKPFAWELYIVQQHPNRYSQCLFSRIITHIVAQPEAFSTTPRAEANPWHVAAGGSSGILSMIFGKH